MPNEEDYATLMEELPNGENHGGIRTDGRWLTSDTSERPGQMTEHQIPVNSGDMKVADLLLTGGWHAVTGSAHRGVLHPDEYVDDELLHELVAAELGYTYEQIRSVYKQGGPRTAEQRELRAQIDGALLTLSREGGNMTALADALGLDDNVIKSALSRAR